MLERAFGPIMVAKRGEDHHMKTTRAIAESYLAAVAADPEKRKAGYYVRLAYKYDVPVGRIILLTGLSAAETIAHIERRDDEGGD